MEIIRYIGDWMLRDFNRADMTIRDLIIYSRSAEMPKYNIPIKISIPDINNKEE